jgi:DNA polymerase IV
MKVYLIQAKLDSSAVHDLYSLLDTNNDLDLQLSGDPEDADVIVTAIRMKRRLERHVDWNTAVSQRDHSLHY